MDLLDKIDPLKRDNELYNLIREDGLPIGVTDDHKKIPQMISEEYCGVKVKILDVIYNKQNYSYRIEAELIEEGDDEPNLYEFELHSITFYQKKFDKRAKFVVLRGLEKGNVFWTMNLEDNVHSVEGELLYEELYFTNSDERAILKCNELRFK